MPDLRLQPMSDEAQAFIDAYAEAWAADVAADPPPGPLLRVLMDWNTDGVGRSFSFFAIGEQDQRDEGYYWWSLDEERQQHETARTWEVFERPAIAALFSAFEATIPVDDDGYADDWMLCRSVGVALAESVRRALAAQAVVLANRFTIKSDAFVDSAEQVIFEHLNAPEIIAALRERDELPDCY